jgi:alpha-tubulin suppressor-like RCC1 family protein
VYRGLTYDIVHTNVRKIHAGNEHILMEGYDGCLYVLGNNSYGQHGKAVPIEDSEEVFCIEEVDEHYPYTVHVGGWHNFILTGK